MCLLRVCHTVSSANKDFILNVSYSSNVISSGKCSFLSHMFNLYLPFHVLFLTDERMSVTLVTNTQR